MKRVEKVYPLEFKFESVRRYLKNNRSLKETAKELGIPLSTLKGWQVKYMNEIKKTQIDKPSKKNLEDSLKE